MLKKFLFALLITSSVVATATAQEVEVDRYNITARIDLNTSTLETRAALTVSNLGQTPKSRLYFRLNKLAKVTSATVNGASAKVDTSDDRRVTALSQVIVTPASPLAPGAKATVEISYNIQVPESTVLTAVDPGEVVMTPDSVWFPMPSTMFTIYGATTAPFTLTVTAPSGMRAASSGAFKSEGQNISFDQTLNSLPFLIASGFDQPESSDQGGVKLGIFVQQSADAAETAKANPASTLAREQVARLRDESGHIIAFLTKTLGPPPTGATFNIISSARLGSLAVSGAVVLSERVFRQSTLDAGTIELLADAIARSWIDGRVRLRGQEAQTDDSGRQSQTARSSALLRDSLPRYLAALYIEDHYGKEAGQLSFARMRWSYTPIAQAHRDAEMDIQTPLFPSYASAVFSKGPLVLRLLAQAGGREKLIGAVKQVFAGPQTKVVNIEDFHDALVKATGPDVAKLYEQWVNTIVEPDILIGIPLPGDSPGTQKVNLRNLGTGDLIVPVLAVTASGKQLTANASVPSEDIASINFQTSEKISWVEADPEKLLIQTDYDNDRKPVQLSEQTVLAESIAAFNKGDYKDAESKLREGIKNYPDNPMLHAWFARALAASNKPDEAATEANAAIKITPPMGAALTWAHISLGQIAMTKAQPAQAVEYLRRAVAEAVEAPAQYASRQELIKAERAANITPQVEESLRTFIARLDTLMKQPSSDELFKLISRNNMKQFVQRVAVTPPTAWTTEILRVEYPDANHAILDVGLKVTAGNRNQSGTAVYILHRAGSGWMLDDVQLFNVN